MVNLYKLNIFMPVITLIRDMSDIQGIMQADSKSEAAQRIYEVLSSKILNKTTSDFDIFKELISRVDSPEHELKFLVNALHQVMKLNDSHPFKDRLKRSICITLLNYFTAFLETAMLTSALIDAAFSSSSSFSICKRILVTFSLDRAASIININDIKATLRADGSEYHFDVASAQTVLMEALHDLTGIKDLATLKKYTNGIYDTTSEFVKSNFSFFYNKLSTNYFVDQRTRILDNGVVYEDYHSERPSMP